MSRKVQSENTQNSEKSLSRYLWTRFSVNGRRPAAWVGGIDTLPVVVDHDIAENDSLNLRHRDAVCMDTIEFFFLQRSKEALHSGVIIAFAGAAHALDCPEAYKRGAKDGTGELAASVRMKYHSASILVFTGALECLYAESRPHITAIVEHIDTASPKGFRDRVLIILMYDTGARVGEIVDIKLCDLRFGKTPTITLHGKGNKIRCVPLMEKTVLHLQKYLSVFHPAESQYSQAPLFYSEIRGQINPLSDRRIRYLLKDYGAKARLHCPEIPEKIHPHLFRHSRAMHLYQQGMDLTLVSQWLGHANLETTQVYAHADTEHKRKAIAAATPAANPLHAKLSSERFTISDEDTLKRLTGLR